MSHEDPNNHIDEFLAICDTIKQEGVTADAIRVRLFPFSLIGEAKEWLLDLPDEYFTKWSDLEEQFIARFVTPTKIAELREKICTFRQFDAESLYQAWVRFKRLLRKCPKHGIPRTTQIQIFLHGLDGPTAQSLDYIAGGIFRQKTTREAFEILDQLASNHNQRKPRDDVRKVAGVHEIDQITMMAAKMDILAKNVAEIKGNLNPRPFVTCENCGDAHPSDQCQQTIESARFVGNFNSNKNNPYSNTYNPGWRQHPNFSWSENQGQSSNSRFQQTAPPPQEKKPTMEEMFMQYMARTDATLRTLETQVGQLANALTTRSQGSLPSNTEPNPRREGKEQCQAVTLRNGRELQEAIKEPKEAKKEVKSHDKEEEVQPPPTVTTSLPKVPFPQRLQKQKLDKQFSKFLEIFKKLHINIPFAEALEQMPSYVKFMKDILSKKRRLGDYETVTLTEECSAIIQNKLPPKLKDPGSFTIPCTIGNHFSGKALCDLGASINLMPYSIYRKLGLGEAKPTSVTLQLADRSLTYPKGVIEDVLVKVDKFIFPADFVILDMEVDTEIPIILGRPFMATGRTLIDVQKGELTMRVQDQQVTFNVFKAMKYPDEPDECFAVDVLDKIIDETFQEEIIKDPLERALVQRGSNTSHSKLTKQISTKASDPCMLDDLEAKATMSCCMVRVIKNQKKVEEHHKGKNETKNQWKLGEQVYVTNPWFKFFAGKRQSRKLGPFRITQMMPKGIVELEDEKSKTKLMVNLKRIKPIERKVVGRQKLSKH